MAITYDSKDVRLAVGFIPISGFGDNKITISRTNDVSSILEGVDGENVFSVSNKKSGTVSFDLQYGTDWDTYLETVAALKYLVQVTFSHTVNSGSVLGVPLTKNLVTFGMVQSQPDIELGETPSSRTWTLVVDNVDLAGLGLVSAVGTATRYIPTVSVV